MSRLTARYLIVVRNFTRASISIIILFLVIYVLLTVADSIFHFGWGFTRKGVIYSTGLLLFVFLIRFLTDRVFTFINKALQN